MPGISPSMCGRQWDEMEVEVRVVGVSERGTEGPTDPLPSSYGASILYLRYVRFLAALCLD